MLPNHRRIFLVTVALAVAFQAACSDPPSGDGSGGGGGGGGGTGPVASVEVNPNPFTLWLGQTDTLVATARDAAGRSVSGVTFTWAVADPSIASITNAGGVKGLAAGSTTVTASASGVTSPPLPVTVEAPPKRLVLTTRELAPATTGVSYSQPLAVNGGAALTWGGSTIAPPNATAGGNTGTNGITIGTSTGVLSGTPLYKGFQPVIVRASDGSGSVHVQYELEIGGTGSNQAFLNTPSPGTQGVAYDFTLNTTWYPSNLGCVAGLTRVYGSFPPGFNVNGLNGRITGTPQIAGEYTFTLYADAATTACNPQPTNFETFRLLINPASSPTSPPGASGWTKPSTAPVLQRSVSGWDGFLVGAPSVVKVGSTYFMYYEGQDATDYHYSIGVATSSDGVTWTKYSGNPVIRPLVTPWASRDVRAPTVHHDGTTFRMWYWGTGHTAGVGMATSTDGLNWTVSDTPVSFSSSTTPPPGAVVHDGTRYVMVYPRGGALFSATSTDGLSWTDNGTGGNVTSLTLGRPAVVYDAGTYRAWFSMSEDVGGGAANTNAVVWVRMGHAYSTDRSNWTNVGTLLNPSMPPAWDRPSIGMPTVLKEGSGFTMWYTGGRTVLGGGTYDSVEGAIGRAVAP